MEAARGGELFAHVVATDGLDEAESAPIFAQLVDAVSVAHALGIAHRDLKLENVLLAGRKGERDARQIKLIDWGLAHQHSLGTDGRPVGERLHSRCGSRSYMAPEVTNRQISSVFGYDGFAADVWSLGVCLFAIHLGFFPFEQADPEVDWRARRVVEAQNRGGSTIATICAFYPHKTFHLSRPLCALLDRMLAFDPTLRASLSEVVASEWLAGHMPAHGLGDLGLASGHSSATSSAESAACSTTSISSDSGRCSARAPEDGAAERGGAADAAGPAARVERQDSNSTAHSIGSSVGSSVAMSNARLRQLEAVLAPYDLHPSDLARDLARRHSHYAEYQHHPRAAPNLSGEHGEQGAGGGSAAEAAAEDGERVHYAVAGQRQAPPPRSSPAHRLQPQLQPQPQPQPQAGVRPQAGVHPELVHLSALLAKTRVAAGALGSPIRRRTASGAANVSSKAAAATMVQNADTETFV